MSPFNVSSPSDSLTRPTSGFEGVSLCCRTSWITRSRINSRAVSFALGNVRNRAVVAGRPVPSSWMVRTMDVRTLIVGPSSRSVNSSFPLVMSCVSLYNAYIPMLKISVLSSGAILLDGNPVDMEQLEDSLKKAKEANDVVWYYREASAAAPPPQAMQVIQLIVNDKLT